MTEEEIERRYIESLSIPEKAIKDIPVLRDDLTFAKLKQYLINKGIHINEETFYKNFGLVTADGKFNLLAEILADENINSIKVAVFKGKDKSEFVKRNEPVKLTKSAIKVLQALKTNPESTIDGIVTDISVSRETVKRSLKTLSEKGLIKRVGSDKTGHWEIIE